jgi:hypothetical protein
LSEQAQQAHVDIQARRTEPAAFRSDAARLGLILALLVLGRLNDHALLVPDGFATGEQLEAASIFRVPVEVLALDALKRDTAARTRGGRRHRLERRPRS